jgi:branched-chain amino acid transport system ATP-binding protein
MASDVVLSVRQLSKRFGALEVARSIDLELERGARLGLIGPNGAGKTTLLNLLTGVVKRDSGSILLEGRAIEGLRPEERVRRGLVRTHQLNTLLGETSARHNVAIAIAERDGVARRTFRYRKVWQACVEEADAQLGALGIARSAERAVNELPYGEQRLLEIAIALALKPRVLLLDEPAAGVPSGEVERILAVLQGLPSDMAIVLIEHDMDLVFSLAREIVVLVAGAVFSRKTPEETANDPGVRAIYLGHGTP